MDSPRDEHGFALPRALAEHNGVPPERIAAVIAELRERGLVAREDGGLTLTAAGHSLADRALAARRELLTEALADESADRDPTWTRCCADWRENSRAIGRRARSARSARARSRYVKHPPCELADD